MALPAAESTMVEVCRCSSTMALNVKNAEVERVVADVARITGESKTEAVRP
jgi:hypothetical protein